MPTQFQERIYKILKKVPKGKVTTYKVLASKARTKAYRAVGTAMNKNPYAPKVPCHRVICSSGFVGQYGGGMKKKMELLRLEGVKIDKDKFVDLDRYLFRFK